MIPELPFSSRRSPVICLNGCVASSQPLASNIGLDILKRGGNAADAAVAVAAALSVTEPNSTGLGGDCFCVFYDVTSGQVRALNGCGRAPKAQTLDLLEGLGFSEASPPGRSHALSVTVPGAAAGWCDTLSWFGSKKLSLQDVLQPAIELALKGFPVPEVTAHQWAKGTQALKHAGRDMADFLINKQPPTHGQVFTNPALAQSLEEIAQHGKAGFYEGRVAEAIVDVVGRNGGVMSMEDLREHVSTLVTPISTQYRGVTVWEVPPNGQGMAALIALNILENFPIRDMEHNSATYLHVLAEALKLSMADTFRYCADPDHVTIPLEGLLSKDYSQQRARLLHTNKASCVAEPGSPAGSDTVYFSVVDGEGNACSFVNSIFLGFGTGLVPPNCGFPLHNRGNLFSLKRGHGNCVGPKKRPYHTIIPAMLTDSASGRLLSSFGVMGGFMQPQGHVQVLLNMLEFGMNPQQALDAPRIRVHIKKATQTWRLDVEMGVEEDVAKELEKQGHVVRWPLQGHRRSKFGRGQVITVGAWWDPSLTEDEPGVRVLWAGSDPRADGCAYGY